MGALLLRLRSWWETADKTAKIVTIFGSAFLVLLLAGTFYFASRPKMTLAYGGLAPAEAGGVVAEIQKLGVPVESDIAGNIFVPSSRLSEVRSKIAMTGKLPQSTHLNNEDMMKLNAMFTPEVERQRLKAILEGELATSIEAMQGVSSARVHVTLGQRSAFASDEKPPAAAVYVQEQASGGIGLEQARSIAMLVSKSVDGLKIENVFVTDNSGRVLFDGSSVNTSSSQASEKLATEISESRRRERDLQATFDATFGRGNTVVKVNLAMDFDKVSSTTREVKTGKNPVMLDSSTEEVKGGAQANGNVAGAAPGTPAANDPNSNNGDNKAGSYTSKNESAVYPETVTNETKERAAGSLKTIAVSVMVNKGKADPEAVKTFLTNYLAAYEGAKADVTEVEFDTSQALAAAKASSDAASNARNQQMFSLLPVVALFIVAAVVMKGLAKTAKSHNVLVTALPNGELVTRSGSTTGSITSQLEDGESHSFPQRAEGVAASLLGPSLDDEDNPEIRAIREKLNIPLEQIKKMANEKPEAVAMLIKSWLLEERR